MPANPIEIHESKLEGVEYLFLTLPKKIHKNGNGEVTGMTCIRMELGEPDASGRRRPVPVEGSDFELKIDYILAAIGQKTDVNFIGDINTQTEGGKLLINKWGDIDARKDTLQTGIPSVFAAGDGVTGPATIIEAIAQAKIAATSAHQFVMGMEIKPEKKPFTSKKENFRKQAAEDYKGRFREQLREEMPVLAPDQRNNFREVELGYADDAVALHEAQRCLECGCTAFFDCDLQKYSTEYSAVQKQYEGEYREFQVDFHHPYIEIDRNKCILCGRCIRICREVVGADALGFVNRGFDTYVTPSMGDSLVETTCESCGMCISTCPTGAISENVLFKPGPVKTKEADTICNYCSVGCAITLHHRNGFIMGVTGKKGQVNRDGNLCRYPKFGYRYLNDPARITKPMQRYNGGFREITFEQAYGLIHEKIRGAEPDESAFFAGARLSNEEMYLVQKLARAAVRTNNIGSFHYLGRGSSYFDDCRFNASFDEIRKAGKIYLVGTEINRDHAVAGFLVSNARFRNRIPVAMVTVKNGSSMDHKVDENVRVGSYYYFIKALNHYLLKNGLENRLFLRDRVTGWEEYREQLISGDFDELVKRSGINDPSLIGRFAEEYNLQLNAIVIFSEKEISSAASRELFNLALITGKLGKTASGIIALKEKNNSQGLADMGIDPHFGTGMRSLDDRAFSSLLKERWNVADLARTSNDLKVLLNQGKIKNLLIFGEDPVGCAVNGEAAGWMKKAEFRVVQDYFMTPTMLEADLVLPASFPAETGGTFTNALKVIQPFESVMNSPVGQNNLEQLTALLDRFSIHGLAIPDYVLTEIVSLLPAGGKQEVPKKKELCMTITDGDDGTRIFDHGCDAVTRRFEEEFKESFGNTRG
jgi:formate dehydrogenase major subunit